MKLIILIFAVTFGLWAQTTPMPSVMTVTIAADAQTTTITLNQNAITAVVAAANGVSGSNYSDAGQYLAQAVAFAIASYMRSFPPQSVVDAQAALSAAQAAAYTNPVVVTPNNAAQAVNKTPVVTPLNKSQQKP